MTELAGVITRYFWSPYGGMFRTTIDGTFRLAWFKFRADTGEEKCFYVLPDQMSHIQTKKGTRVKVILDPYNHVTSVEVI